MKFFKYSIIALAAVASLASCSDDDDYVMPAQSAGAYFPTTNPSSLTLSMDGTMFDVTISRTDTTSAVNYAITNDADASIFTVPSSVDFAAGQKTAHFAVQYDSNALGYDNTRTITFTLNPDEATEYGRQTYSVSVVIPAPWISLGEATYVDAIIADFFSLDITTYKVEMQENSERPGYYRLINPYLTDNWPYSDVEQNVGEGPYYMYIDATDPDKVGIPLSSLGVDFGYGECKVIGINDYFAAAGATEHIDPSMYGKYNKEEGVIDFPAKSIVVNFPTEGWLISNQSGLFKVYMPGIEVKDFSGSVGYSGLFTSAEGESAAIVNLSVGGDITSAKGAIMATRVAAEAFGAIADGSVETQDFAAGADQTASFPVSEAGWYTVALVGYNGDEQVMAEYATFEIKLGGDGQGNWEAIGDATMVDGWIIPLFLQDPNDAKEMAFAVPVEKSLDQDGIYRLVSPYSQASCPLAQYNENSAPTYIVIDATDPAFVTIEAQYSGFTNGGEQIFIGDAGWFFESQGYDREAITSKGFNSTLTDGVINVTMPLIGSSYTDFGYNSAETPIASSITLPAAQQSAPAKAPRRDAQISGKMRWNVIPAPSLGNRWNIAYGVRHIE